MQQLLWNATSHEHAQIINVSANRGQIQKENLCTFLENSQKLRKGSSNMDGLTITNSKICENNFFKFLEYKANHTTITSISSTSTIFIPRGDMMDGKIRRWQDKSRAKYTKRKQFWAHQIRSILAASEFTMIISGEMGFLNRRAQWGVTNLWMLNAFSETWSCSTVFVSVKNLFVWRMRSW